MRFRSFLPLVLLLAGCRSERVAVRFAPGNTAAGRSSTTLAQPVNNLQLADRSFSAADVAGLAAPVSRVPSRLTPRRALAARRPLLVWRPKRLSIITSALLAPRATALGGPHPAERGLLLSGGISTVAGLLVVNFLRSSGSMALLSFGQYLLVLGSLLLLGWFILLLLRAMKE